jgi:hypothetical protein
MTHFPQETEHAVMRRPPLPRQLPQLVRWAHFEPIVPAAAAAPLQSLACTL